MKVRKWRTDGASYTKGGIAVGNKKWVRKMKERKKRWQKVDLN